MNDYDYFLHALNFYAEYDREKQMERLDKFLKEDPSHTISQWLYQDGYLEGTIDKHIGLLAQAHAELKNKDKEIAKLKRPIWKRFR